MLYPTIDQLTDGSFNRYEIVIATAKCARMITDEYIRQRETAEKAVAGAKDSEKGIRNMVNKEYRDEKAVKVAINHIKTGDFVLSHCEDEDEQPAQTETEAVADAE
jgi:DNA-directed RNA polymerase omega subunit